MREILFRGKREDSGEWVYGYLNCHPSPVQIGDYNNPWAIHVPPVDPDDNGGVYWTYPSTIGQYTGLTDKNGVKIFEGDICDFTVFDCLDNDTQYRSVVVYSGSRFMLWKSVDNEYYGADGGFDLDEVVTQDDEFEIIGNIQDNPELLKETRNAPTN